MTKNKPILTASWFGGLMADTMAIRNLKLKHKLVDYVELDKHSCNAANIIHNTSFEPKDINDVDVSSYPELDILVAGWPCQDYSVAGKGLGLEGSRSNLILLTISKIKEMKTKPRYIILENVKGLLSKKHKKDLLLIKDLFNKLGYCWEQALFNAKYFGVPQARERVFVVLTRKDCPRPCWQHLEDFRKVEKTLEDILDFSVPAKVAKPFRLNTDDGEIIYATNEMSQYNGKKIRFDLNKLKNQDKTNINKVGTLGTIQTRWYDDIENGATQDSVFVDHTFNQKKDFLGIKGVSKTLRAGDCDNENKVCWNDVSFNQDKTFHGIKGVSPTLTTSGTTFKAKTAYLSNTGNILYRKLSVLETWRLMGFSDEDYKKVSTATYKLKSGKEKRLVSDSQMTKQAGNSIVVPILEEIINQIVNACENMWDIQTGPDY